MQINVTFDQDVNSLPASFVAAINYVVTYLDTTFSNPVVVNIEVGYGEIDGQPLASGALGESESFIDNRSYSSVVTALKNNEPTSGQQSAYATLPATSPVAGGTLWLTTAQEKALGLLTANDPSIDGFVGFSSTDPFYYGTTGQPANNQYYFIGVALHEFTEIMGRVSYIGARLAHTTSYSVMDLFRYSAAGTRQLSTRSPAYFSINSGNTNLANWNTNRSGDLGDWASSVGHDSFLAFSSPGVVNWVSSADLLLMNVIGWDPANIIIVSGGQTSSGLGVPAGTTVDVLSGGTTVFTTLSGGAEIVRSGGLASGTFVFDQGLQTLSGAAVATTVYGGGTETVLSGAQASGAVIYGGLQQVMSGGFAYDTTVNDGGTQELFGGASASGTVVNPGGVLEIISGYVLTSYTVGSGATLIVAQGGVEISGTVTNGGIDPGVEIVSAGGSSVDADLDGGIQYVFGAASGTVVKSGGVQIIQPGGFASGSIVSGDGEVYVSSGGVINGATLAGGFGVVLGTASGTKLNGGTEAVLGQAFDTIVNNGGLEIVEPGGSASGSVVSGGGEVFVDGGGTLSGATLDGGLGVVSGTARGTKLNSGTEAVFGQTVGTTVSGGAEVVRAGGLASGAVVSVGGQIFVYSGGVVRGATLSGGFDVVYGTAVSTTIKSGGAEYDFGSVSGTIVSGGGVEVVEAGGLASGSIASSGGQIYVIASGTLSGATIGSGGYDVVYGTAVSTTIKSGGGGYSFGVESGTIVSSGGVEVVEAGALASGSVASSGGQIYVVAGGALSGARLSGGYDVVFGTAVGTTIKSGSVEYDYGSASGSVVSSGGVEIVQVGAVASGSVASSGGQIYVVAGGTLSGATLSGGYDVVYGTAVGTVIKSGGAEYDFGSASGTVVSSGGVEVIEAGGTATGTQVNSGGVQYVVSGGTASGTLISGGTVEITSGATIGSGVITFATSGGGTLRLDDSVHFGGLVASFGLPDQLDLVDIPFVVSGGSATTLSWTQLTSGVTASGTLTVSEGGHVADITLLGQYVAGNFHIQTDGAGGTLVTDPPVSSSTDLINPH